MCLRSTTFTIPYLFAAGLLTTSPSLAQGTGELVRLQGYPFQVLHSAGQADRAQELAGLCARTIQYMDTLLGFRPVIKLKVLAPGDWDAHTRFPMYGMPHYTGDSTLVIAAEENALWDGMIPAAERLDSAQQRRLEQVYGTPSGRISMRPFFDLLVLHELGHAYHNQAKAPVLRRWMGEQFSNIFLHTYIAEREPVRLDALTLMPDLVVGMGTAGYVYTSLTDLEAHYNDVAMKHPKNYGWYQCRWHRAAAVIHAEGGALVMQRLWAFLISRPGPLDDAELARRLEVDVHPALARVMTDW